MVDLVEILDGESGIYWKFWTWLKFGTMIFVFTRFIGNSWAGWNSGRWFWNLLKVLDPLETRDGDFCIYQVYWKLLSCLIFETVISTFIENADLFDKLKIFDLVGMRESDFLLGIAKIRDLVETLDDDYGIYWIFWICLKLGTVILHFLGILKLMYLV